MIRTTASIRPFEPMVFRIPAAAAIATAFPLMFLLLVALFILFKGLNQHEKPTPHSTIINHWTILSMIRRKQYV
ncbi:MAG: hypothetical protein RQ739_01155 [Desulfotignum sp.]|nr:hypothetical protein [Desulfotignum sp.]